MAFTEDSFMTQRTLAWGLRRPAHALSGMALVSSLGLVLVIATGWALIMHSVWVGITTLIVAAPPLWWMPAELESTQLRFRRTLLLGGLMAAIHLFIGVMR